MTLNINQVQRIRSYYNQGLSIRQIARKTRTDKNTILKYIHSHENQPTQLMQTRSIKYDLKRIPINISPPRKSVSSKYHKHHSQSIGAERQRYQSFPLEIPYNQDDGALEKQHFFNPRYPKQIDEKNHMLEKTHSKQQLELVRKQQENQKRVDDFLQKIELERQQNNTERRINEEEFNKKIMLQIQEMEQNIFHQKKQDEDLKKYCVMGLERELKKIDTLEQNKNKMHTIKEQISQQCVSTKTLNEVESEANILPIEILPIINFLLDLYKKFDNFSYTSSGHLPRNSPIYWQQLSEFLRDDLQRKHFIDYKEEQVRNPKKLIPFML